MDRPFGREHRLIAFHPDVARLAYFTHEMTDSVFFGNFEIEISLHTTAVHVGRHRVPYAARSKLGHTHLELAGRQYLVHQHLIDITMVGAFQRAHFSHYRIGFRHFAVGIVAMCSQ